MIFSDPFRIFPLTPDWWEVDHGVIPKRNVRTPERVRKVDSSLDKRRQQFESLCLIAEERRRISDITKSRQFHLLSEFIESSERVNIVRLYSPLKIQDGIKCHMLKVSAM